ncbi:hypothetical protein ACKWTF_002383 [Chironomus riparius]
MTIRHSPKNKESEGTPRPIQERKRKQIEEEESDEELQTNAKNQKIDDQDDDPSQYSFKGLMAELKSNEAARRAESIEIRNDIATLREDVMLHITGLKGSLDTVTTKVSELSTEVKEMDVKIVEVAKIANENRKLIGSYKQDKLEKFMEIDGIKSSVIDKTNDCKKLAIEIIESFGISIDTAEIEHAFKKEFVLKKKMNGSDKKKILTVIFSSISSKIRVMKAKRDINTESSIYFNQAITAANRNLIYKAKSIVGKELKVFFARGYVRVQKKDENETEIIVDDLSKLEDVQEYFDEFKRKQ